MLIACVLRLGDTVKIAFPCVRIDVETSAIKFLAGGTKFCNIKSTHIRLRQTRGSLQSSGCILSRHCVGRDELPREKIGSTFVREVSRMIEAYNNATTLELKAVIVMYALLLQRPHPRGSWPIAGRQTCEVDKGRPRIPVTRRSNHSKLINASTRMTGRLPDHLRRLWQWAM